MSGRALVAIAACAAVFVPGAVRAQDGGAEAAPSSGGSSSQGSPRAAAPAGGPTLGFGDVRPQGRSLGLGVSVGGPLGLAGKYYLDGSSGIAFILGFWASEYGGAVVDYVFHPLGAVGDGSYGSPYLTAGGGVAVGVGNNTFGRGGFNGRGLYNYTTFNSSPYVVFPPGNVALDVHGTLGLGWSFKAPLDLFIDFSPSVLLVPTLNFGARMSAGGRIYLN